MGIKTVAALADGSINNTSCIYDIAFSKKCQDGWQTWVEMRAEYQGTLSTLQKCREKYKNSIEAKDINDWEELGSMIADVKHMIRELDQKIMYEVHAIPLEEDILAILTPLQIQVVRYHEEGYRFSEVASLVGISPSSAIKSYKQAIKKIEKFLEQATQGTVGLTPQQEEINNLKMQGMNTAEIAAALDTSIENVKYQLKEIKKKTSKFDMDDSNEADITTTCTQEIDHQDIENSEKKDNKVKNTECMECRHLQNPHRHLNMQKDQIPQIYTKESHKRRKGKKQGKEDGPPFRRQRKRVYNL